MTPKFYVENKPSKVKVVPTQDYWAVQCYGQMTVVFDASAAVDSRKEGVLGRSATLLRAVRE
jgi:predicted FMN-binding regulatory protein PaiB